MQLWDKKVKRDDELTDSEDEGEGSGGRRFEKDGNTKTSSSSTSKKLSGEVSMDISKTPSPTVGSIEADGVAVVAVDLGLSLPPGAGEVAAEAEIVPAEAVVEGAGADADAYGDAEDSLEEGLEDYTGIGVGDAVARVRARGGDMDVDMVG